MSFQRLQTGLVLVESWYMTQWLFTVLLMEMLQACQSQTFCRCGTHVCPHQQSVQQDPLIKPKINWCTSTIIDRDGTDGMSYSSDMAACN